MAVSIKNAPIPLQDPIAEAPRPDWKGPGPDPKAGYCTDTWAYYLSTLTSVVSQSPNRVGLVALTAQNGSIAATDFSGGITTGLYRVSYYVRITTPGSVSSSLTVTVGWADHGTSLTLSGTAMTGNTTATLQQYIGMIYADAGSPITYATTYASTGGTAMQYELYLALETVSV